VTLTARSLASRAVGSGRDFTAASDEHQNNESRGRRNSPLLLGLRALDGACPHHSRGAGEYRVDPLAGRRAGPRHDNMSELRPVARPRARLFGTGPVRPAHHKMPGRRAGRIVIHFAQAPTQVERTALQLRRAKGQTQKSGIRSKTGIARLRKVQRRGSMTEKVAIRTNRVQYV
jgi:hypothetical protein